MIQVFTEFFRNKSSVVAFKVPVMFFQYLLSVTFLFDTNREVRMGGKVQQYFVTTKSFWIKIELFWEAIKQALP